MAKMEKKQGMRPRKKLGDEASTTTLDEAKLWKSSMKRVFGENFGLQLPSTNKSVVAT